MLTKMFGNFWTNVVIVVNFWSFKKVNRSTDILFLLPPCFYLGFIAIIYICIVINQIHDDERRTIGVTPQKYSRQLTSLFEQKFDLDKGSLPLVFIDTHYNRYNEFQSTPMYLPLFSTTVLSFYSFWHDFLFKCPIQEQCRRTICVQY